MEFIKLPKVMSNKQAIPNFGITSEKWVYYNALIGDDTSYMLSINRNQTTFVFDCRNIDCRRLNISEKSCFVLRWKEIEDRDVTPKTENVCIGWSKDVSRLIIRERYFWRMLRLIKGWRLIREDLTREMYFLRLRFKSHPQDD